MSEYLSKKAVLEWLREERDWYEIGGKEEHLDKVIAKLQSGAFDADESEGTWKATAEVLGRENAQLDSEIQRLRAAAIKLHETLNTYWQGDCEKADVVAVQSKLCDVLGVDRDDELYGDWTDERCPKCGANLLGNKVGDKWCSLVGCDYSINAPEKVGTEEWRHKYFGA